MKAKFKPKVISDYSTNVSSCAGQKFNFAFAYKLRSGEKYYQATDLKFPTSTPINERDLEIVK